MWTVSANNKSYAYADVSRGGRNPEADEGLFGNMFIVVLFEDVDGAKIK